MLSREKIQYMSRSYNVIVFLFLIVFNLNAQNEYTVPQIITPAKTIPSIKIPGKTIPGKETAIGKLPDVVIEDIFLPAIYLDSINTGKNYNTHYDLPENVAHDKKITIPKNANKDDIGNRNNKYIQYAPETTQEVIDLFVLYDIDGNGKISIIELQHFQNYIFRTYKYQNNTTALPPAQFIKAGGGDCEDFAIMTAEFLIFWGETCLVGGLYNSRTGHAIALLKIDVVPKDCVSINIPSNSYYAKMGVPEGNYIPIDYNYVGGYSTATEAGMKLKIIWSSREIIGEAM
jgi:hypothetical protein